MPDESLQLKNDDVLLPFLSAESETAADECLNRLFDEIVIPQIKKKLTSYLTLSRHEKDEILSDTQTKILGKLRKLRLSVHLKKSLTPLIQNFPAYIAKTTENCRKNFIWAKKPIWRWTHNRLKMLRDEGVLEFFTVDEEKQAVCLSSMAKTLSEIELEEIISRVCQKFPQHLFLKIQELAPAILKTANGALRKNDLIKAILEIRGAANFEEVELPDETSEYLNYKEDEFLLANRQESYLHDIWTEIKTFKPHLRKVALLSLRESRKTEAITLLLVKRIATIEEIADALEVKLKEFSEIFAKLPMSSRDIADFLSIEDGEKTSKEQKVDNIRKEVRKLLRKRLGIRK